MGNARGNHFSRRHVRLRPDGNKFQRRRFWQFSWNEIGMYDLPAMIDYVLEQTLSKQLHYIGHSQGTTSFFVMASERPEYNEKILLMQALAPVVFMTNMQSALCRYLAELLNNKQALANVIGLYELLPSDDLIASEMEKICRQQANFGEVCTNIMFLCFGYDSELFDEVGNFMFSKNTINLIYIF